MSKILQDRPASRRDFLGKLAGTAALIGISNFPLRANAEAGATGDHTSIDLADPDEWFKTNIKGKHKIVFDTPEPKEVFTFAWPLVFLLTNKATGSDEKDCSVVVVLRHNAIPYALGDSLWAKYK